MPEPLTNKEYAEWKTHIGVIANMHANPDVNEPYNDITVNLGTELRLFATIDDLRNQFEGKKQAFETLQKAHDSLVDQFKESRRAEGALAPILREMLVAYKSCGSLEESYDFDWIDWVKRARNALKLTDL